MHKKLWIILLSTFVISCLFSSGFTEWVSYTVEGNTTQITLANSEYEWVSVLRWDNWEAFSFWSANCTLDWEFTTCRKTYEDGNSSHEITINNFEPR